MYKMYTDSKSMHCVSKNTHFVKLHISCLQYHSSFSRSNWKILHLAKFFTQPAVVMVVTNMRCDTKVSTDLLGASAKILKKKTLTESWEREIILSKIEGDCINWKKSGVGLNLLWFFSGPFGVRFTLKRINHVYHIDWGGQS